LVTKTEELYSALLSMKVVSFDEIVEKAKSIIEAVPSRRYIYRKYVDRLIKKRKLHRVRRGLYIVLSPIEKPETHVVDKLLIASKIRNDYYLGFHTALEFYGYAHSFYNEAYICIKTKDRFNSFQYKRLTFLECIDRVQYAGGWEECLKSLEGFRGLDFEKLVSLLHKYERDILFRRVGYILELS